MTKLKKYEFRWRQKENYFTFFWT